MLETLIRAWGEGLAAMPLGGLAAQSLENLQLGAAFFAATLSRSASLGPAVSYALALAKLDSEMLFAGKREVIIVHRGEEYRLRITRQEKLILTK